jgi:mannose-6-phosphate isomerase
LVKFLDAAEWLSIQVHPNDAQAKALEGDPRGKTEAWIVLRADEGAQLIHGVKPGTSRPQMAQAIRENQLEGLLVYSTVQAGDVLFVEANTVHALGAGLLIYEIQQSSDITYRLYDYGRLGLDGQPRQLHIEKGTQVSNVEFVQPISHPAGPRLVECPYFVTERYRLDGASQPIATEGRFHALSCIEGHISLQSSEYHLHLGVGQSTVIPACLSNYTLSGQGVMLNSFQP